MTIPTLPYGGLWGDPDQVAAIVEGIRENAARLGLIWRKMVATVAVATDANGQCMVRLDGDPATGSTQMPAVSEIGALAVGTRVWCLWAPPQGLYVTGLAIPVTPPATQTKIQAGFASVSVTAATSATVTVTLPVTMPDANYSAHTNIVSGAGATANWHSRAITYNAGSFVVFVFGPSSTWSANVAWTLVKHGVIDL